MSVCARVLFGIGGCLGLLSSIMLIIAVAAPSFSVVTVGDSDSVQYVTSYGLTKFLAGCANQRCRDALKIAYPKSDGYEKACKASEKTNGKDNGRDCSDDYSSFTCTCTFGDMDMMEKHFVDNNKKVCDPKNFAYQDKSGCDKFEYDSAKDVFDATVSARGMTMIMLVIAIIFGFLMTITSYASAALLHPIGGWVAVCTSAVTMLFSIIGLMTAAKYGLLTVTLGECGNWSCYESVASHDGTGDKLVATFWFSQILIVVSVIQTYVALCLVIIGAFVAMKSGGDGGALGEKLT